MQGCALPINSVYTGWVNEEDEYIQGRGGEGLRLGNLEDEDDNRDIIMARLARITGLKRVKIYDK